jgi:4'-phosphopantetheinyl transferase
MNAVDGSWCTPPTFPTLSLHDVHVWRANLDQSAERIQQLAQILSSDEKARAERFYFEQHRQRFIVGRGLLRTLVGSYLGLVPAQLQFTYGDRGKPTLATLPSPPQNSPPQSKGGQGGVQTLRFNLSHSSNLVLYAFTLNREIGIDIEQIRPMPELEQLSQRFFSPQENAALLALPPEQRNGAFFNCWTRKEAYIKAMGDGLALSLDRFEVSLAPGEPARLVSIDGDTQLARRWSLQELNPGAGYAAAIATEGHDWQMSCWQWSE